jgi:hypothetical protein
MSPLGTTKPKDDDKKPTGPKIVTRGEMEMRVPRETTTPITVNTTGPTNPLVARAAEIINQ